MINHLGEIEKMGRRRIHFDERTIDEKLTGDSTIAKMTKYWIILWEILRIHGDIPTHLFDINAGAGGYIINGYPVSGSAVIAQEVAEKHISKHNWGATYVENGSSCEVESIYGKLVVNLAHFTNSSDCKLPYRTIRKNSTNYIDKIKHVRLPGKHVIGYADPVGCGITEFKNLYLLSEQFPDSDLLINVSSKDFLRGPGTENRIRLLDAINGINKKYMWISEFTGRKKYIFMLFSNSEYNLDHLMYCDVKKKTYKQLLHRSNSADGIRIFKDNHFKSTERKILNPADPRCRWFI